jgi:hypothetical protein
MTFRRLGHWCGHGEVAVSAWGHGCVWCMCQAVPQTNAAVHRHDIIYIMGPHYIYNVGPRLSEADSKTSTTGTTLSDKEHLAYN